MDPEAALKRLEAVGIVSEDNGQVTLADAFEQRVEQKVSATNSRADSLGAIRSVLSEYDPDLESVAVELLLDHLLNGFPPADGVPDNFFPSQPDQLRAVFEQIDLGLVYVWEADNQHCTVMANQLDELTTEKHTEHVLLLAVCGQGQVGVLERDLDVHAIPTTLFVTNGRIDTRLQFCPPKHVIEAEWEQSFGAE